MDGLIWNDTCILIPLEINIPISCRLRHSIYFTWIGHNTLTTGDQTIQRVGLHLNIHGPLLSISFGIHAGGWHRWSKCISLSSDQNHHNNE